MADNDTPAWISQIVNGLSIGQQSQPQGSRYNPYAPSQSGQFSASDILGLLRGTARQSQTTAPFRGKMPVWMPQQLAPFVRAGVIDPYLGTGQLEDYRVYMGGKVATQRTTRGNRKVRPDGQPTVVHPVETKTVKGDRTLTLAQAMNEPYLWDEDEVAEAIKKFQSAGMDVKTFDDAVKAWGGLVQRAGQMYSLSSGERKVTPWDVLDLYKNEAIKSGNYVDPNRREVTVSRSVHDITEGEAWANLQRTVSEMLGHDPSDDEVRDFTYRMNSLAAKNPSITKTITQYKNGEAVSQTSNTKSGFSAADVAQQAYEDAQADPDYAEYQAATTYFNTVMSAIGAIGGS